MLKNIIETITARLVIVLLLAAATASTALLSHTFSGYADVLANLADKVEDIGEAIQEEKKARFDDNITLLAKQVYKINIDPDDVRPMDVSKASDFCVSRLFDEYKNGLTGSEKVKVMRACARVDLWVIEQDA